MEIVRNRLSGAEISVYTGVWEAEAKCLPPPNAINRLIRWNVLDAQGIEQGQAEATARLDI